MSAFVQKEANEKMRIVQEKRAVVKKKGIIL